jgi:hypothetical protein
VIRPPTAGSVFQCVQLEYAITEKKVSISTGHAKQCGANTAFVLHKKKKKKKKKKKQCNAVIVHPELASFLGSCLAGMSGILVSLPGGSLSLMESAQGASQV